METARISTWIALTAALVTAGCDRAVEQYDIVIRGGTVVDGTGADRYQADVAIRDDRIVQIGDVRGIGNTEIEARIETAWRWHRTHPDGFGDHAERCRR